MEVKRKIVDEKNVRPFVTPRQKRQRLLVVALILVFAALGVGAYSLLVPKEDVYRVLDYSTATVQEVDLVTTEQASGAVEIQTQLHVRSPEQGYAAELHVQVGDEVAEGQILARIDVPELEEELSDLESDLETARLNLRKTIEQNQITVARSRRQIAGLESDIEKAREDVEETKELVKLSSATRSDVEKQEEALQELIEQKQEKEISLAEDIQLQDLDIEIRRADLDQMETRLARLKQRVADATIRSSMDGEILEIERTLGVPGSVISANQALFTIADPGSAIVELEVDEEYAALLSVGGPVKLTVGGSTYTGTVANIGKVAEMSSDGLGATLPVSVTPHVEPGVLLQGASAVGEFELGVKENALVLPRGPYLTTGSQRYVYRVAQDGTAVKTEVTYGETQADLVEVLKGLSVGDQIVSSGYQNYIEYKTIRMGKGE